MSEPQAAPRPRQRRAEITRDKICAAAIELLGQGGAKAVTHRAVAAAAAVSLASTTYHFADKSALLTAAFEWLIDHFIRLSRNRLEEALRTERSVEALTRHVMSVSNQGMTTPAERIYVCAWYEFMLEASRDPQLQPTAAKWYDDTCAHYQEILEGFGSRSPPHDGRRLLDFLIGYEFIALATRSARLGGHDISETYGRMVGSLFGKGASAHGA